MKTHLLNILITIGLLSISCENDNVIQEIGTTDTLEVSKTQSSMFDYIKSINIANNTKCENTILIFPSWDKYWETIDKLDDMIENDCDSFDATVPADITDDEYDSLADASGFDEDNTLHKFENDLAFCSLRSKIESLENDWLDKQGDGDWNINEDPDNHFIEDETERSLLSSNSEVIIGKSKDEYIYYKRLDDFYWIEVQKWDIRAIEQVSNNNIPTNNTNVIIKDFRKEMKGVHSECKYYVRDFAYHQNGSNRIKRKSKVINNSSWGYKKASALTVGYKKKRGKWRRRRTWITAGVTAVDGTGDALFYYQCSKPINQVKLKERRRRRVKAKIRGARYGHNAGDEVLGVMSQKVYGIHKQGSIDLKLDYYEMN